MNASLKTLLVTAVATAAAAVMTFAHAYAPEQGEPLATLAAEQALNGFIQAAYDRNFAWNGEPIATVEAETALQGFLTVAQATMADTKAVRVTDIQTVAFPLSGDEPVVGKAAGDALTALVNQMNNNCQPGDEKFGCVIDPTKPSPLPGKSLWAQ